MGGHPCESGHSHEQEHVLGRVASAVLPDGLLPTEVWLQGHR